MELKLTAVYRLWRESSLLLMCAVRGAHRSVLVVAHAASWFVLLVVPFLSLAWMLFFDDDVIHLVMLLLL